MDACDTVAVGYTPRTLAARTEESLLTLSGRTILSRGKRREEERRRTEPQTRAVGGSRADAPSSADGRLDLC